MSKCPFWSTTKKKVNCYSDCPMFDEAVEGSECVFREHVDSGNIDFKDIVDYDYDYSKDNDLNLDFVE